MAKRKKIEVNILSFKSIELAIKELKAEKERQEELIDKFMDKVALGVCSVINSRIFAVTPNENNVSETDPWGRWNTDITMAKYDRDGHNRKISVSGSQVAFIEFGAGAEANPGIYPTKGGEKEAFLPGSWSKDHSKTYQVWEASGYSGLYKYEQHPARGFDTAISDLPSIVKKAADEVFR